MRGEKRQYVRWRKKIRVTYTLSEDDTSFKEVFTEDLSEMGVQILAADKLEPGQAVRLKIEFIYDSVPIMAVGKVAFVKAFENQYRVGLEFMDMDDFGKLRLKRNLDKIREGLTDGMKEEYA